MAKLFRGRNSLFRFPLSPPPATYDATSASNQKGKRRRARGGGGDVNLGLVCTIRKKGLDIEITFLGTLLY